MVGSGSKCEEPRLSRSGPLWLNEGPLAENVQLRRWANNGLVCRKELAHLFDNLVGGCEQRWRHREAERLGGFEVDDK